MVTQFGMSELIGPLAVGDKEQEIFLGREFAQRREISERTAQMVDGEVKRLIDEAYARASTILSENRELLDRIAQALLDRETIDREDLDRLVKNQPLPPRTLPPAEPAARPGQPEHEAGRGAGPRPDPRSASGRTRRRVNVTPLALHSPRAVREALRSHGWEEALAEYRRRRNPHLRFSSDRTGPGSHSRPWSRLQVGSGSRCSPAIPGRSWPAAGPD